MALQLEFNIENKSFEEMQFMLMQKQIDEMCESMGKVRRKLFSELGEMKKICANLEKEKEDMKAILNRLSNGKTQWTYGQDGQLFDIRPYQEVAG